MATTFRSTVTNVAITQVPPPPPPAIPDANWPDLSGLGRILGQLGFGGPLPPASPPGVSDTFDPSKVTYIRAANTPPVVPPAALDPPVPPVAADPAVAPPVPPPPVLVMPYNGQTPDVVQQIGDNVTGLQQVLASQKVVESGPTVVGEPNGLPGVPNNFQVTDETTGAIFLSAGAAYPGPVVGITSEYVDLNPTNLGITGLTAGVFMHSGAGDDTLTALAGSNLLNAGGGSNMVVSGSGTDTIIVASDALKSVADVIQNFHAGDDLVVTGLTMQDFTYAIADGTFGGAPALSINAVANNKPDIVTSIMLPGHSAAELDSGKLQWAFSSDSNGTSFMSMHAT